MCSQSFRASHHAHLPEALSMPGAPSGRERKLRRHKLPTVHSATRQAAPTGDQAAMV